MIIAIYRQTGMAQDCGDIHSRFTGLCQEYEAHRLDLQQLLASVTVG